MRHDRTRLVFVLLVALVGTGAGVAADTVFTDVTVEAGVDYLQYQVTDPPFEDMHPYMSGGAAAGDFDGDGWVDLYVTRLDRPDILFRNRGDGTFEDVTAAAGLDLDLESNGAGWGDIDNDGDLDLYVTCLGNDENRFFLFVNDGAGRFTEEAVARGAAVMGADSHYGFSVAFGDYDLDGWLDIHTTEWRVYWNNPNDAPSNSRLLRNRGAAAPGHFDDVTVSAGVVVDHVPPSDFAGTFMFASEFADMDDDGWPDLLIAADFGTSRLFWNNGDGTFTDGTDLAGVGSDENGMGSAIGDWDGDGRLDWFVTSIFDPNDTCNTTSANCAWGTTGNRLYRNEGGRSFSDATDAAGVRDGYWGWGAAMVDYDNDADLDIVMTNGIDFPFIDPTTTVRFSTDPMRMWRNDGPGGPMPEISQSAGLTSNGSGKGLLTFDYDRDGDVDLLVVNNSGHPVLYRNDGGNRNPWLRVRAHGEQSNSHGIGARVEVRVTPRGPTQMAEIRAGSHFLGQSEAVAHFGLGTGPARRIHEVSVFFPASCRTVVLRGVRPNQVLDVHEPTRGPLVPLDRRIGFARLRDGAQPATGSGLGEAATPAAPRRCAID